MILLMLIIGYLGPKYFFLLITLLVAYGLYMFYRKVGRYPKGPRPLPLIGNAHQMKPFQLHTKFEEWNRIYGDVFTVWVFHQPLVVLMKSKSINDALVIHGDNFVNRTGEFPENVFQCVENGGILFASGENWREQRRNALHILRDFGVGRTLMEEQIHTQLKEFIDHLKEMQDKDSVDMSMPIQIMVSNIINRLLFGYSYPHNKSERLMAYALAINSIFSEMFSSFFMIIVSVFPFTKKFPYIGYQAVGRHVEKYKWCLEFVKEDVKKVLEHFSKDDEPTCFAQAYYQKNLYNVCADFFMAGMETTTTTLRWGMLYLAGNQDVQEKIRQEIASTIGFDRLPSLRDKIGMPYTIAFIVELQRIANLIPFSLQRKATEDVEICGKLIPAGTAVVPQIHSILYDENLFPEPKKLRPERFLNHDGSLNTEHLSNVVPFGMGKRQCAGESLAKAELFLGFTVFLQKFNISPTDGEKLNFEPTIGATSMPKPHNYKLIEVNPSNY